MQGKYKQRQLQEAEKQFGCFANTHFFMYIVIMQNLSMQSIRASNGHKFLQIIINLLIKVNQKKLANVKHTEGMTDLISQ